MATGFLLKNSAARRRKAVDAVFVWFEDHGIDPEADCFGAPAASAFVARLLQRHHKGPYTFVGAKRSKLLGPGGFELSVKDVKKWLWGEDFKVFNLDAQKESTQDLKAQLKEAPAVVSPPPAVSEQAVVEDKAIVAEVAEEETKKRSTKRKKTTSKKLTTEEDA